MLCLGLHLENFIADFFAPSDSRLLNSYLGQILFYHTSIQSLIIQLSDAVKMFILKNGHVRGHILYVFETMNK